RRRAPAADRRIPRPVHGRKHLHQQPDDFRHRSEMSMAQISQLDLADASAEQRAAHDEELRLRGRMTNMKRTLMHSPVALRVYGEWFALRDELAPVIGDRAILTLCL